MCVASLHYCADWGEVTIATGDEAVLGDVRWRDEREVWCCCVRVQEFGSLKASLPPCLICYLLLWECHGCHGWFVLWGETEKESEKHTRFIPKPREQTDRQIFVRRFDKAHTLQHRTGKTKSGLTTLPTSGLTLILSFLLLLNPTFSSFWTKIRTLWTVISFF